MNVLINPINGMVVVVSSLLPIIAAEDDTYRCGDYVICDPRPSSGVTPVEMDFPEESYCEYQIRDGAPVRIVEKQWTEAEKADRNASIDAEIGVLEQKQMRAVREALLGYSGATKRLASIDRQVEALRSQRMR